MPKHVDEGNSEYLASVKSPVSSMKKTKIYLPAQQERRKCIQS